EAAGHAGRRARAARGRRRGEGRAAARAVRRVRGVQDRRVGAVLLHGHRLAPRDVPAGAAMTVAAGRLTLCCADLDARPLFWTEPDGTRDGYEPDAAACVAAALGLELVWEFRRWDRFAGALADGEVDAI